MAVWVLETPYGEINCHKGRSYGDRVWKPIVEKKYGVAYFKGDTRLYSDKYAHVDGKWIPARGNDDFAKKITWDKWEELGKPMSIEGKKLGIVVKKMIQGARAEAKAADTLFKANVELKIPNVEIKRLVTEDAKYIVPERDSIELYKSIVAKLSQKNAMLVTQAVAIMKGSGVRYVYGIVPTDRYLLMIELLSEDLLKPFPPDALIPGEDREEVGDIEEEDVEGLI